MAVETLGEALLPESRTASHRRADDRRHGGHLADADRHSGIQGTEFVSRDLDLWAYQRGVTLDFSRPGKPTDNAFIESQRQISSGMSERALVHEPRRNVWKRTRSRGLLDSHYRGYKPLPVSDS